MAFLLPNLSPSLLLHHKPKEKTSIHQSLSPQPKPDSHYLSPLSLTSPSASTSLQTPPLQGVAQVNTPPGAQDNHQKDDFYLNLGLAVRTLREDLPLLFTKDLNYDIYRDDITFVDPLNTFSGIEKYKLIFWALRFHGKILFHEISLEVYRIWQPSENVILIRWNLKGVPRVPWEAKGEFQGTSRYKLDRNGKIYEHKVDNLAFNFPQRLRPAVSVLDLVGACPASPNPTFLFGPVDVYTSSWLQFYRAVRETLDQESCFVSQDGMLEEEISMYFLFCCFGGGGEAMAYIGERVMINVFLMSPSCPPKMGEVMAYIGERVMINVFLMSPSFPPKTGEVMAYIGERAMINVFLISPSCPPQTGEAMAYIGELIQDGYVHVYKKLD